jgi:hypothetical protein
MVVIINRATRTFLETSLLVFKSLLSQAQRVRPQILYEQKNITHSPATSNAIFCALVHQTPCSFQEQSSLWSYGYLE